MWHMHASTFNKWQKKKKKKVVTLHMLTHSIMRGCGLTSLMICINDKFCDIRERNVTTRSEIWTTNIRSLRFWDIRERVTLGGLILRSLGCVCVYTHTYTYTHELCKWVLSTRRLVKKHLGVSKVDGQGYGGYVLSLRIQFDVSCTFENLLCINLGCGETT